MKKLLDYLLFPVSVVLLIVSFIILVVPISILALPFKWQQRRTITGPFWWLFSHFSLRVICLARITRIDRRDGNLGTIGCPEGLYIANHQSFMDIPMMLTNLQSPPIMKKEILYIPLLGICAYSSGSIIVNRKDINSRKRVFKNATDRLTKFDKSLQFYPEGTRQKKDTGPKDISDIKKPIIKVAYKNGIKVFPISIYGTRKLLNEKTAIVDYGRKIGVICHKGIDPKDFDNEEEFINAAWTKVQTGYYELEEKLN